MAPGELNQSDQVPGCLVCQENARQAAGVDAGAVAELSTGWVRLHRRQRYRGATFFAAKACVREVYHLDPSTPITHLEELARVAEAVEATFRPIKMNIESLGNGVPHLHWWITPRYATDARPRSPIWEDPDFLDEMRHERGFAEPVVLAADAARLRAELARRTTRPASADPAPTAGRRPRPSPGNQGVRVAGVDGCRAGWVVVTADFGAHPGTDARPATTVEVVSGFGEIIERVRSGQLAGVGIDIPIGLLDTWPRPCDALARSRLGPRRSSVFPAPLRVILDAPDYREASRRSQAACGKRPSKQLFNILPKIAEVDGLMDTELQTRVVEVHPELCFSALAGGPMAESKRSTAGRTARLAALRPDFPDLDAALAGRPKGCQVDDVLDAFVAAWTARRVTQGTAMRLGGDVDGRGLRAEMWA